MYPNYNNPPYSTANITGLSLNILHFYTFFQRKMTHLTR